jgi:hypothetical protein
MPATAKKFERPNVHRIAEEELHAADNDADTAVAAMIARIEDDDVLFRSLMQTALYDLCAQAVQGVIGRRRRVIWDEPRGRWAAKISASILTHSFSRPADARGPESALGKLIGRRRGFGAFRPLSCRRPL